MGSSGSATTTSTYSPPQEVMQNYQYVTDLAKQAQQQPFTPYGGEMVAGLTPTQEAGVTNVNQAVGTAAPYYGQAFQYGTQAAQPIYPSGVPMTDPQLAGMSGMYGYAGAAAPGYMAGLGQTQQALNQLYGNQYLAQGPLQQAMQQTRETSAGYSPGGFQAGVQGYMSPYMNQVVGGTLSQLLNQQAQQQSALKGQAIGAGAYGGDRARIAQAELANQQNLALGATLGNLLQTGYGQAAQNYMTGLGQQGALASQLGQLGTAQQAAALQGIPLAYSGAAQLGQLGAGLQQTGLAGAQALYGAGQGQQQLNYQAAQADRAARAAAAGQMGQLGTGAQAAALQGAQAQLAAGAQQQAVQQALDQAQYNQFLQQQAYPFQSTQFLANIAEGIGAGSGGTSATTQPGPSAGSQIFGALGALSLLSDPRAKENMKPVGETYDGQKIYKFNYKGDPRTQIGLNAAETEHHKPEAVHRSAEGLRGVDYDVATKDAADRGHFMNGGLASMGGAVSPSLERQNYATRGGVESGGLGDIIESLRQYYKPDLGMVPYGQESQTPYGGVGGYIPKSRIPVGKSTIPEIPKGLTDTSSEDVAKRIAEIRGFGSKGGNLFASGGLFGSGGLLGGSSGGSYGFATGSEPGAFAKGGVAGERSAFETDGYVSPNDPNKVFSADDLTSRISSALGAIESGQDYSALGPVTKSGDRAHGFSQVMGANIPGWSRQYYGKELTPEDYLNNPQAQVAVTRGKVRDLVNAGYSPQDVASIWFTGRPRDQAGTASDVTGTTTPEYVSRFNKAFGVADQGVGGAQQDQGSMSFLESALGRRLDPDVKMALLTGALGTMASSSPFFGVAVGQGGLGAVANYVQQKQIERQYDLAQQKMNLETAKTQADVEKTKAEVPKLQAETKKEISTLYEKIWVPGYGYVLIDKSDPLAPPKRITDEKLNSLTGVKPADVPTRTGSPEPEKTPEKKAEGEPDKKTELPEKSDQTGAIVAVPSDFTPDQQFNIQFNPERKKAESELADKQLTESRNRAAAAENQMMRIGIMDKNFDALPKTGFLAPGTMATERLEIGKAANTILQGLGGAPMFNTNDVAALEELVKDKFRLGAELSRSIGGREPGYIVEQSVSANPGAESSAQGYKRITEGLRAAGLYEQDRNAFLNSYAAKFGHLNGGDELFRKLNPKENYVKMAITRSVDPTHADQLKNYVKQYPDARQSAIDTFDRQYGKGTGNLILGGQ